MNTKEAKQSVQMDKALFDFYGKPSIGQSLPLAVQHVLAMIVGCVTPSIIVAGVAGLSQEDSVILIQAALVMSALTTLIQLFPFIKTKWFTIGAGLPVMMGISFAYVPSMQAIAADFDIATILGAQIVDGFLLLLLLGLQLLTLLRELVDLRLRRRAGIDRDQRRHERNDKNQRKQHANDGSNDAVLFLE